MKKLAVIVLCLCLCAGAMAELSAQPLYTYEAGSEVEFLDSTDRIAIRKDRKYAIAAEDGTLISDYVYDSIYSEHGVLRVEKSDNLINIPGTEAQIRANGVVSVDNAVLIPVEYIYVDVFSSHWGAGYTMEPVSEEENYDFTFYGNETYRMKFVGIDLYDLDSGKCVAQLTGEEYYTAEAEGDYINIVNDAGVITAYDANFNPIEAELHSTYDFSYVPTDETETTAAEDTTPVPDTFYQDGKWGIQNADGGVILPAEYDFVYISGFYTGFASFNAKKDDVQLYGLIGIDGTIILEPAYEEIYVSSSGDDGYASVKFVKDGVETWGFADPNGNMILPAEYETIRWYGTPIGYAVRDGKVTVFTCADGIVDLSAVPEIGENDYIEVDEHSCLIKYKDDTQAPVLIRENGAVTVLSDFTYASLYVNGDIIAGHDADYKCSIIDCSGKVLFANAGIADVNSDKTKIIINNDDTGCCELYEIR